MIVVQRWQLHPTPAYTWQWDLTSADSTFRCVWGWCLCWQPKRTVTCYPSGVISKFTGSEIELLQPACILAHERASLSDNHVLYNKAAFSDRAQYPTKKDRAHYSTFIVIFMICHSMKDLHGLKRQQILKASEALIKHVKAQQSTSKELLEEDEIIYLVWTSRKLKGLILSENLKVL